MLQPNVPAWFEIPAVDLDRAVRFYEAILAGKLTRAQMGPMSMAVFPYEKPGSSGAVVKAEGFVPAATGTVVYLHLDDIRPVLDRVPNAGGAVLLSRTPLPDEMGFFAQVRDTEGNRVGLFSQA
jgi:predicted enzyme related to lactoylglutathione lyase